MDPEFKQDIVALAKIIDTLDYYEILQVRQKAFTQDIKKAYFEQSRLFHPDKYYNEDPRLLDMVTKIFKRVCEAYKVLSNTDKRAIYTKAVKGPDRKKYLRYSSQLFEELEKGGDQDEGQTPMGKKYYQMAKTSMANKDYNSAKINLQLAAKMEPANETFKKKLEEVTQTLKLQRKKNLI